MDSTNLPKSRQIPETKEGDALNTTPITTPGKKRTVTVMKMIAIGLLVVVLVAAARLFDLPDLFRTALTWLAGFGVAGLAIFVIIYIIACVLMLPGSVLTLGVGAIYGVVQGTIAVSIGSTLGATAAFLVGRYLAREWVARRIAGNEKFKAVDEAVGREGWKIVLLTRLSPLFPFNLLNYAYGLTQVRLKHYILASWVGMMPGTIMYVYLGALAGDLASLGGGARAKTPGEWSLFAVGLLATVAVTVLVTRIAKRALATRIPLSEGERR
jgi:uncharacterized membrane protein YdjX (TVP38/TMEM64 family)